jgi:lipopolysaccharide/colanic/teichoic acid biosynthesis glycosyltransferase
MPSWDGRKCKNFLKGENDNPFYMIIPPIKEIKNKSYQDLLNKDFIVKLSKKRSLYKLFKRFVDIVFAISALFLLSPVWLIIILLIRLDSKGKAIFSHERVGLNGRLFTLHKFRTMQMGVKSQEFAPVSKDDKRITKIGRFLRRTSLDEIPQFWNVLKGEMSFIGPRPEMQFIVNEYNELQRTRLLIKPGITGLWQIAGRKDLPLHKNIEFDLYYILKQSVRLDLIILWKTITVVIKGKGAY